MSQTNPHEPTDHGNQPDPRKDEAVCTDVSDNVSKILEQYLQPKGALDLPSAVKQILELLTDPDPELMRERINGLTDETMYSMGSDQLEPANPFEWRLIDSGRVHGTLGGLFFGTAREIPYDDPAHIKFARLLNHLTPRADDAGKTWAPFYPSPAPVLRAVQPHWQTILFQSQVDDRRRALQNYHGGISEGELETQLSQYVNFNAFLAYLGQFGFMNMTHLALAELRECFEEDWENPQIDTPYGYIKRLMDLGDTLDLTVDEYRRKLRSSMTMTSTLWVLIKGNNLFTEMVQSPKEWTNTLENRQFVTGPLYTGPIFGIERWIFWRENLEAAASGKAVDEKAAELAGKAANLMQALQDTRWHSVRSSSDDDW